MENVTVRKPPRQKMLTFTEKEIRLFFQKWEEYQAKHLLRIPYACIFHVAYETGMRPEEDLGLQFSDLYLDDNPPHIRVQRVAIRDTAKGGWWFDEPKTSGSVRNIPISRELAENLRRQRLTVERYKQQRGGRMARTMIWSFRIRQENRFTNIFSQTYSAKSLKASG